MEAVVELPEWAEVLERNPRNRDRFLALDPREFIATLERWMLAYCPDPTATVPGLSDAECASSRVPTLVFRSGASDPHHTRATSERLAELIPAPALVEPPWPDDEWNQRGRAARKAPARSSSAGRCSRRSCWSSPDEAGRRGRRAGRRGRRLVVFALVDGDDDTRCRYRIGGGAATLELPCGLDRGSVRTYVIEHPELVTPDVPTLGPN